MKITTLITLMIVALIAMTGVTAQSPLGITVIDVKVDGDSLNANQTLKTQFERNSELEVRVKLQTDGTTVVKDVEVMVEGHKMFLDSVDTFHLCTNGYHEPIETDLIKKHVKRGDVVLDLGANIGYFTLILPRLVGEEGKVFAFEPDPENFALLKKNVEINSYQNVVLVQKAVSNRNGKATLYLYEEHK